MVAHRTRPRTPRPKQLLAAATGVALAALVGWGAPPASAATAHGTGDHTVCADSLTLHTNGQDYSLRWGDPFYIDHFAGDNHVWGWYVLPSGTFGPYGWVINDYFC
jgi:hypothetical protein